MAHVKIELDRGYGWQVRQEGDLEITADALAAKLPAYAISYPHRAYLDGKLVAEVVKPHRGMKAKVIRY